MSGNLNIKIRVPGISIVNGFGMLGSIGIKAMSRRKYSNEEMFIYDSPADFKAIRARIKVDKLISYFCSTCDIDSWRNDTLVLHVDHIDGDRRNNNLKNLRYLCPNCHSQTDTYCGKKNKVPKAPKKCSCGSKIFKTSRSCRKCSPRGRKIKILWPNAGEVILSVKTIGYRKTSILYGVTDNSVRKFLRRNGIDTKSLLKISTGPEVGPGPYKPLKR